MDRSILRYSRKANDTASKLAADISSLLREKGFREKCPHALAVPFPTTGAAALKIYNSSKEYLSKKLGDDFTDRLWKDYAYMDLTHDLIQIACS